MWLYGGMLRARWSALMLLALVLAGCAAPGGGFGAQPAGTRCREDRAPGGPDPGLHALVFIFCRQSP